MVEYLLHSGKKCLDFQANNKHNRKSGTPVEIQNSSLPPESDLSPNFEDIFSIPTKNSVPDLVSTSTANHSKTLITEVVNTSTGEAGGWFGFCSLVLDTPTTAATTGLFTSSALVGRLLSTAGFY